MSLRTVGVQDQRLLSPLRFARYCMLAVPDSCIGVGRPYNLTTFEFEQSEAGLLVVIPSLSNTGCEISEIFKAIQ